MNKELRTLAHNADYVARAARTIAEKAKNNTLQESFNEDEIKHLQELFERMNIELLNIAENHQ